MMPARACTDACTELLPRRTTLGGDRVQSQTATLTGEVAIQIAVPRKTAQPIASIATRSLGEVSLVLMPAKNSAEAKRTTPST